MSKMDRLPGLLKGRFERRIAAPVRVRIRLTPNLHRMRHADWADEDQVRLQPSDARHGQQDSEH
jgi:hypothetical protein